MRRDSNATRVSMLSGDSPTRGVRRGSTAGKRRGSLLSGGSGISNHRKQSSGEDSSIPFEWLIGTTAYERPIYQPQEPPQILIPKREAITKPSIVRETIGPRESDIELLGIGSLSIIGSNESSRVPSRSESRGNPHTVTPRLFSSSTLISQAAELHQVKEKRKQLERSSRSAQYAEKRNSIAAYRFLLANSPSKESARKSFSNNAPFHSFNQDSTKQHNSNLENSDNDFLGGEKNVKASSPLSKDFSSLFHHDNSNENEEGHFTHLQSGQVAFKNELTNKVKGKCEEDSFFEYPQLSLSSSSKFSSSGMMSKKSVIDWASSGLDPNDPFSDKRVVKISKVKSRPNSREEKVCTTKETTGNVVHYTLQTTTRNGSSKAPGNTQDKVKAENQIESNSIEKERGMNKMMRSNSPMSPSMSQEEFIKMIESEVGEGVVIEYCSSVEGDDNDDECSVDTNNIQGNIYNSYLSEFDSIKSRASSSPPPPRLNRSESFASSSNESYVDGSNPIVQKFRLEEFPIDEDKIKRVRGTFVGGRSNTRRGSNSTKPVEKGCGGTVPLEMAPINYEKNFRVVNDEDYDEDQNYANLHNYNLIKSYKPPLMRPSTMAQQQKEQEQFKRDKREPYMGGNEDDAISAFMSDNGSIFSRQTPPSPSKHQQRSLHYDERGLDKATKFIAYLGPESSTFTTRKGGGHQSPNQKDYLKIKRGDQSLLGDVSSEFRIKHQQNKLHNISVKGNGDYEGNYPMLSPNGKRNKASSSNHHHSPPPTLSPTSFSLTPADLNSPTRTYPIVAFGSRAYPTPGVSISVITSASQSRAQSPQSGRRPVSRSTMEPAVPPPAAASALIDEKESAEAVSGEEGKVVEVGGEVSLSDGGSVDGGGGSVNSKGGQSEDTNKTGKLSRGSNDIEIDEHGVMRKSFGKLKPLQGDRSNLSLEEAEQFAASYSEWMVAEVHSPLPDSLKPSPSFPNKNTTSSATSSPIHQQQADIIDKIINDNIMSASPHATDNPPHLVLDDGEEARTPSLVATPSTMIGGQLQTVLSGGGGGGVVPNSSLNNTLTVIAPLASNRPPKKRASRRLSKRTKGL